MINRRSVAAALAARFPDRRDLLRQLRTLTDRAWAVVETSPQTPAFDAEFYELLLMTLADVATALGAQIASGHTEPRLPSSDTDRPPAFPAVRAVYVGWMSPAGQLRLLTLERFEALGGFAEAWGDHWHPLLAPNDDSARRTACLTFTPAADWAGDLPETLTLPPNGDAPCFDPSSCV